MRSSVVLALAAAAVALAITASSAGAFADSWSCSAIAAYDHTCWSEENGGGDHHYSNIQGWYGGSTSLPISVGGMYTQCFANPIASFADCLRRDGSGNPVFYASGWSVNNSIVSACDRGNCSSNDGNLYAGAVHNNNTTTHTLTGWGYAP